MTIASINAVIVLHAFGPYSRGEMLTDPAIISAILNGGHASMVVQTKIPQHYLVPGTPVEEH